MAKTGQGGKGGLDPQKEDILTTVAFFLLFVTAFLNWNYLSLLTLGAVILLVLSWYYEAKD